MLYFDTDVIIHFLIIQDVNKHEKAKELFLQTSKNNKLAISLLTITETAFVLGKLNLPNKFIVDNLNDLLSLNPYSFGINEIKKANILAEKIGFKNINDCIHTEIAKKYCRELITFNKNDFKKIQNYTDLKITIL